MSRALIGREGEGLHPGGSLHDPRGWMCTGIQERQELLGSTCQDSEEVAQWAAWASHGVRGVVLRRFGVYLVGSRSLLRLKRVSGDCTALKGGRWGVSSSP